MLWGYGVLTAILFVERGKGEEKSVVAPLGHQIKTGANSDGSPPRWRSSKRSRERGCRREQPTASYFAPPTACKLVLSLVIIATNRWQYLLP